MVQPLECEAGCCTSRLLFKRSSFVSQHRLCRDSEAKELGHRAAKRRNRRREEEHARPFGFSYSPPSSAPCGPAWSSPGSAGCLPAHRMLWVAGQMQFYGDWTAKRLSKVIFNSPTVPLSAQRSAQELPVIESVSLTSCSVEGGEELLLSGSNFLPISRVLFMERGTGKGPQGTQNPLWCCFLIFFSQVTWWVPDWSVASKKYRNKITESENTLILI